MVLPLAPGQGPVSTPVNLNTAPPEVLLASVPGLDIAQARALVQARSSQPMTTLADASRLAGSAQVHFDAATHVFATRFFSVTGQLQLGSTSVQEVSVLQRDGQDVKVLRRTREVVPSAAASTLQ
ncbi:general secretion pathway protein K [mine drainage metagenome]|uniref:General secretion pathway protein K n=1 Tax=mine drainage metagenome TaxID=410659 RepID=A0A1J5PS77_9ZZZZ